MRTILKLFIPVLLLFLLIISCTRSAVYQKDLFEPPLLQGGDNLSEYTTLVGNINFGDTVEYSTEERTNAYLFDSDGTNYLYVHIESDADAVGLFIYGPRDEKGYFGSPRVKSVSMSSDVSIRGFKIEENGTYLIFIIFSSKKNIVEYRLSLGCVGNCTEPPCEDISCGIFCGSGRLDLDENFCLRRCRCVDAALDQNNKYGEDCTSICESESYDPVCGIDGKTYANICELKCYGVQLDHGGECSRECNFDTDCGPYEKCIDGSCVIFECDCPDQWDPVCGSDGYSYKNRCELFCSGATFVSEGVCAGNMCLSDQDCGQSQYCKIPQGCDGTQCSGICMPKNDQCQNFDCAAGFVAVFSNGECRCIPDPECPTIYCPYGCNYIVDESTGCLDCSCLSDGECAQDSDCKEGEICRYDLCPAPPCFPGTCSPPYCSSFVYPEDYCESGILKRSGKDNKGCPRPLSCIGAGCENSSDCAETQLCIDGDCLPADFCHEDVDCEEGKICNLFNDTYGVCVVGCRKDSDCESDRVCEDGRCRKRCENQSDCEIGEICDKEHRRCKSARCLSDQDCPSGYNCIMVDENIGMCNPQSEYSCNPSGCYGEICSSVPVTDLEGCNWHEEYNCLIYSECVPYGEHDCAWKSTESFLDCLASTGSFVGECKNDLDCNAPFEYCNNNVCEPKRCECPDNIDPVCSSDRIYMNWCHMACAEWMDNPYTTCSSNSLNCKEDKDCPFSWTMCRQFENVAFCVPKPFCTTDIDCKNVKCVHISAGSGYCDNK